MPKLSFRSVHFPNLGHWLVHLPKVTYTAVNFSKTWLRPSTLAKTELQVCTFAKNGAIGQCIFQNSALGRYFCQNSATGRYIFQNTFVPELFKSFHQWKFQLCNFYLKNCLVAITYILHCNILQVIVNKRNYCCLQNEITDVKGDVIAKTTLIERLKADNVRVKQALADTQQRVIQVNTELYNFVVGLLYIRDWIIRQIFILHLP